MGDILPCEHFAGGVVQVARDLIGRRLVVRADDRARGGTIIKTEAYSGRDDPASHASFRPGGRAAAMWSAPGTIYVYAAMGVHPCLNIVAETDGAAGAVLVRGIWPDDATAPILGPGRVTRYLGVSLDDHGLTACGERFEISAERRELLIRHASRFGITRGMDAPWRFIAELETGGAHADSASR